MMTKKQVMADFNEQWRALCERAPQWKNDRIAKREAFSDYTDALCKDRQITPHQYNTWTNPF